MDAYCFLLGDEDSDDDILKISMENFSFTSHEIWSLDNLGYVKFAHDEYFFMDNPKRLKEYMVDDNKSHPDYQVIKEFLQYIGLKNLIEKI